MQHAAQYDEERDQLCAKAYKINAAFSNSCTDYFRSIRHIAYMPRAKLTRRSARGYLGRGTLATGVSIELMSRLVGAKPIAHYARATTPVPSFNTQSFGRADGGIRATPWRVVCAQ